MAPESARHRDARIVVLDQASVTAAARTLLDGVSFEARVGDRIAVLGANGAGKTTLLRLIHGLERATTGRVEAPPTREQAFLFQRPVLLGRSVRENIRFALAARAKVGSAVDAQVTHALAACGLEGLADRPARRLSAGEQQRVAIARVWADAGELVLADEPTATLAPQAVREVEGLLLALSAQGRTLIVATHNLAQARRLATRILFLDSGRLCDDVSADRFFARDVSSAARAYLEGEWIGGAG
jgi:tungstate transport system ATP-binding protein